MTEPRMSLNDQADSCRTDINEHEHKLDAAAVPANPIAPPYSFPVRMQLVRQVLADRELTPTDKVIGVCLLVLHLHRTTGQLNPSLDTIAEETRTAKKTIVESRDRLQARRHIGFERGRAGRGSSPRYWPCLWGAPEKVSDPKPFASQKKRFPRETLFSHEKRFPQRPEKVSVEPKKVSDGKQEPKNLIKNLSALSGVTSLGALARGLERRSRAGGTAADIKPTIKQVPRGPQRNPNGDQGRLELEIAKALGDCGWDILCALADDRRQRLYDSYRQHGILSDELLTLKAEAIFSSPRQEKASNETR